MLPCSIACGFNFNFVMPRGRKRKGPGTACIQPSAPTVPTLKEYVWTEMTSILQRHSTVPLLGREISSMAMKKFRCVVFCLGVLLLAA